jgi:3-phenylpropionate/trans-cinnamate dioxygenase ferredoxin reductase subunit
MSRRIVIVGGGQAGGRLAQRLAARRAGDEITLICREHMAPYERPPLSKAVLLGSKTPADGLLWPPEAYAAHGVRLLLGSDAVACDRSARSVRLADGAHVDFDVLVLATGARCRRLPAADKLAEGVHYLRDGHDSRAIAEALGPGRRLLVIGGGFIGLEVAAAARMRGCDVVVVELADRLLGRGVPAEIAALIAQQHIAAGVQLRTGCAVSRLEADGAGRPSAAVLSTGETVPCDAVVVGIGIVPETALAEAAGLRVENGVIVGADLRTDDPAIFACGDAASFWHPVFQRRLRLESWKNAEDHAEVIDRRLAGEDAVSNAIPWFWSDQFDLLLRIAGLPQLGARTLTRPLEDDGVLAFHIASDGMLVGAGGLGRSAAVGREVRLAQMLIEARRPADAAALADPAVRLKALLAAARSAPAA